jgi:hypothetical protein
VRFFNNTSTYAKNPRIFVNFLMSVGLLGGWQSNEFPKFPVDFHEFPCKTGFTMKTGTNKGRKDPR